MTKQVKIGEEIDVVRYGDDRDRGATIVQIGRWDDGSTDDQGRHCPPMVALAVDGRGRDIAVVMRDGAWQDCLGDDRGYRDLEDMSGHPWPDELSQRMVDAATGVRREIDDAQGGE